jgi:hypothetical protein
VLKTRDVFRKPSSKVAPVRGCLTSIEKVDLPGEDFRVLGQELDELHSGERGDVSRFGGDQEGFVHRRQRPGEEIGRLAVPGFPVKVDEESLPEAEFLTVQIQEVVVPPAVGE